MANSGGGKFTSIDLHNPSVNIDGASGEVSWHDVNNREHLVKRNLVKKSTDVSLSSDGPTRRVSNHSMANLNRGGNVDQEERKRRWERFKLNFLYFELLVGNNYVKQFFRILSALNIVTLLANSLPPPFIPDTANCWTIYYAVLLSIDAFLALCMSLYLFTRAINAWYWYRHSTKPIRLTSQHHFSRHLVLGLVSAALWYSVAIESYRLSCVVQCWNLSSTNEGDQTKCSPPSSGLACLPYFAFYIPFIVRFLSLFSASRALSFFKQLRIPSSVIRELRRYYLLKHLLNVFIFYMLVVFIYSLLGVHIIGPLSGHCLRRSALENGPALFRPNSSSGCIRIDCEEHLAILEPALSVPDFHCQQSEVARGANASCPPGFVCSCVEVRRNLKFQADYPNLGIGLFSVYESSTFELWTRTLYDAIDGESGPEALLFFFSMVFFLVILVQESIFLVVIIESFASLRSESYLAKTVVSQGPNQVLEEQDGRLRLVETQDSALSGLKVHFRRKCVWFQKAMIVLVLVDAAVMATRSHFPEKYYNCYQFAVSIWQLLVSVVFALEVLVNLVYYWWRPFVYSVYHWFLAAIAAGSLFSAVFEIWRAAVDGAPPMCLGVGVSTPPVTPLILFQSLRFIRLLWLFAPVLRFANQVLGQNSRIFVTVLAVLVFILIMAGINVQLFAFIDPSRGLFDNIFVGYQSQFQLLFQEGWIELLSELMFGLDAWWLINIWVIIIYFIASLIILNFFTAIILDNLDLDEETKVLKLKEALDEAHHQEEQVPFLWRVSTKIGGGADIVSVAKQPGFDDPQIKLSVMKDFLERGEVRRANEPGLPNNNQQTPPPPIRTDDLDDLDDEYDQVPRSLTRLPQLRLLSFANSSPRPAWGCRERQEGIHDIIYKLKVIRSTRRFDLTEGAGPGEGRPSGSALRVRLKGHRHGNNTTDGGNGSTAAAGTSATAVDRLRRDYRCFDRALFCIPPSNPVRRLAQAVLGWQVPEPSPVPPAPSRALRLVLRCRYYLLLVASLMTVFQWCVGVAQVVLVVTQFLEGLYPATSTVYFAISSDSLFVLLTGAEVLLKVTAHGLVFNPYAALSSIYDLVDWVVVAATVARIVLLATGVLALAPGAYTPAGCPGCAAVLVLWSLRPCRLFSLLPPVRQVLSSLWSGRRNLMLAFVLFNGFVFFFASLGTQLLSGDLGKCNDPNIFDKSMCTGEFELSVHISFDVMFNEPVTNITVPRAWIEEPRDFPFSNVVSSFVTLWSLLPLEGWLVLRDYLDVRAELHNNAQDWLNVVEVKLFIHIYVFIGANIGLGLFVGVIVANYNENRSDHAALLTVAQKQWQDLQLRIQLTTPRKAPPPPAYSNRLRYYLHLLVTDSLPYGRFTFLRQVRPFREAELLVVLGNACTLAERWTCRNEPDSFYIADSFSIAASFSVVFHSLFILETAMKLVALKTAYFHSVRNLFELLLSSLSLVYLPFALSVLVLLSMETPPWNCTGLLEGLSTVALGLAVCRCLTILGKYEVLTSIVQTILIAIVNTIPLMVLVAAILITYANIGTALFGQIDHGEGIDMRHVNFRQHNSSLYLGIRMLTGEDWYQLLWDSAATPPHCSPDWSNCGNEVVSVLYFLSFFFVTIFVFLNLFRAVLLEAFSVFYNEDDTALDHTFLKTFRKHWGRFDPTARGIILLKDVKFLVRSIGLYRYFRYKLADTARERVAVDLCSDALVLREIYHELELGSQARQERAEPDGEEHEGGSAGENPVVNFSDVLRSLAYKAEDVSRRLTPNELKDRVLLEHSIQNEVATACISRWVNKYVKEVLDCFSAEEEGESQLTFLEPGLVSIPRIIEHEVSQPTEPLGEDEGEVSPRPQALPLLPPAHPPGESPARKPSAHLDPRVPSFAVDPPTEEVDPNHIWFEQQMLIDSDDEDFPIS